jgi:hypothetical protein
MNVIPYLDKNSFFNLVQNNLDHQQQNPGESPMLRKVFRPGKNEATRWIENLRRFGPIL